MVADERIAEFNAWAERDGWSTRADASLQFRSPKLRECLEVFTRAADGRAIAARAALTPRAMKNFLSNVVVWDVLRGDGGIRFRVRVMGTPLQRIWRGKAGDFIDEVVPEPFRNRWHRSGNLSLEVGAPLRFSGTVQFANQTFYHSETFQTPLADPGEAPNAILFVHIVEPRAFRAAADAEAEARAR